MPNPLRHTRPGVVFHAIDGSSSTGSGTEYEMDTPLANWSLQAVAASTDTIVTLDLSLQSSSGAAFQTKLTWASSAGQASGDFVTLADTPAIQARGTLDAGASSGGASAWIGGA